MDAGKGLILRRHVGVTRESTGCVEDRTGRNIVIYFVIG